MGNLKDLRDKLNGSLSLDKGETIESVKAEFDAIHEKMNADKLNDDDNFIDCEVVK